MKKILNLTKNEMADAVLEETEVFDPPINHGIFIENKRETYKCRMKPPHWEDTDKYKIVEV